MTRYDYVTKMGEANLHDHLRAMDARLLPHLRGRARTHRPAWIETRVQVALATGEWSRF